MEGEGGGEGDGQTVFSMISAMSLAMMRSCMIIIFLFVCSAAVKKLPEHRFVSITQEKTTTVVKNEVEIRKNTIKVLWSLYKGMYIFGKKWLTGKRESGHYSELF